MNAPSSENISVVLQGPVLRLPGNGRAQERNITAIAAASIRRQLPNAEIILSTWEGTDYSEVSFDKVIVNHDPGACVTNYKEWIANNGNRQITSTLAGIKAATRPFILKWRSDLIMLHSRFLDFFCGFPERNPEWKIFSQRIAVCALYTFTTSPRLPTEFAPRPYHVSDWVSFGLASDMLYLWDIPHTKEPDTSLYFDRHPPITGDRFPWQLWQFSPEQSNTLSLLQKFAPGVVNCEHKCDCSGQNAFLSDFIIANNFLVLDCCDYGLYSLKLKLDQAELGPLDLAYLLDHYEWQQLYIKHCAPHHQATTPTHNQFRTALLDVTQWRVGYKRLPLLKWLQLQQKKGRLWRFWLWPIAAYLTLLLPLFRVRWHHLLVGGARRVLGQWPPYKIVSPLSLATATEASRTTPNLTADNSSPRTKRNADDPARLNFYELPTLIASAASGIWSERQLHTEIRASATQDGIDCLLKPLYYDHSKFLTPHPDAVGDIAIRLKSYPQGYQLVLNAKLGHFECFDSCIRHLKQRLTELGQPDALQQLLDHTICDAHLTSLAGRTLVRKLFGASGIGLLILGERTRDMTNQNTAPSQTCFQNPCAVTLHFENPVEHCTVISTALTILASFQPTATFHHVVAR